MPTQGLVAATQGPLWLLPEGIAEGAQLTKHPPPPRLSAESQRREGGQPGTCLRVWLYQATHIFRVSPGLPRKTHPASSFQKYPLLFAETEGYIIPSRPHPSPSWPSCHVGSHGGVQTSEPAAPGSIPLPAAPGPSRTAGLRQLLG